MSRNLLYFVSVKPDTVAEGAYVHRHAVAKKTTHPRCVGRAFNASVPLRSMRHAVFGRRFAYR